MTNTFVLILGLVLILLMMFAYSDEIEKNGRYLFSYVTSAFSYIFGCDDSEGFSGGLQSLYSNHGLQDIHLTVNNDSGYGYGYGYPYSYWGGYPWHLGTRNFYRYSHYPYLYGYVHNRYRGWWPYW